MGEAATSQGGTAERRFRFELAAHPGSVARARRLAHARLSGWAVCADTCDSAALVISELVTNAIVHTASGRVVCELHEHDDMVRIAVRDEGCAPGEPHPSPQRPDEEHGRGLLLVDALCRAWGAQEHGSGLLVWAELARQDDAVAPDALAPDAAEPRDDLGWGARPKPGRPDDSDNGRPAEASGRVAPEEERGTAPGQQHRNALPGGHRDASFGQHWDATSEHRRDALPEQQRRTPQPDGPGRAGQLGPETRGSETRGSGTRGQVGPETRRQFGPGAPGSHGRGEPERHRHLPAGQPLRRLPEQHGYGAAEQQPHAGAPKQHPHAGLPEQHPHAEALKQHPHSGYPEQHPDTGLPEQHRPLPPGQHPHDTPAPRLHGERP
ncbi:hypothetical protein GCM10010345_16060 [Streptomyces canarius]|uniref:Histidine kinase/HSP90-like ATPase domain-containing protein n=1 Tax=Streptomyces canarius TaxID=285453 RepID=A0ABQ3CGY4_9ACTN|nr:hypothetical protein GCM10010345_16060 [Streptomyces canarius]